MTGLNPFVFYIFASLAVVFSLFVVFKKNPVSSAFSLVLVFFSFAGIYAWLDAHLVAALQILVYAGAIMVLFVFVIMLLNMDSPSMDLDRTPLVVKVLSGVLALALLFCFSWVFKNSDFVRSSGIFNEEKIKAMGGNTAAISQLMFSEYILPFELTSILLLAAIIGAVAIAKRKGGV